MLLSCKCRSSESTCRVCSIPVKLDEASDEGLAGSFWVMQGRDMAKQPCKFAKQRTIKQLTVLFASA